MYKISQNKLIETFKIKDKVIAQISKNARDNIVKTLTEKEIQIIEETCDIFTKLFYNQVKSRFMHALTKDIVISEELINGDNIWWEFPLSEVSIPGNVNLKFNGTDIYFDLIIPAEHIVQHLLSAEYSNHPIVTQIKCLFIHIVEEYITFRGMLENISISEE